MFTFENSVTVAFSGRKTHYSKLLVSQAFNEALKEG
jgi:hypothetical protein